MTGPSPVSNHSGEKPPEQTAANVRANLIRAAQKTLTEPLRSQVIAMINNLAKDGYVYPKLLQDFAAFWKAETEGKNVDAKLAQTLVDNFEQKVRGEFISGKKKALKVAKKAGSGPTPAGTLAKELTTLVGERLKKFPPGMTNSVRPLIIGRIEDWGKEGNIAAMNEFKAWLGTEAGKKADPYAIAAKVNEINRKYEKQ